MASYKFFKGLVSLCVLFSVTSASYAIKPQGKNQQRGSMMKIRIDIDGTQQPLFATLAMSPTVEDFAKQLPLTLILKDYDSTEKIADLPTKLTTQNAPHGYAGKAGDLTYYAPWGNLVFSIKILMWLCQWPHFSRKTRCYSPSIQAKTTDQNFNFTNQISMHLLTHSHCLN